MVGSKPMQMRSANFYMMAWDVLHFLVFGMGWVVTVCFYPEYVDDNPIKRAFQGNNMSVGVGFGFAHVLGQALIGLSFYPLSMFTQLTYYKIVLFQRRSFVIVVQLVSLLLGYWFSVMLLLVPGTQTKYDAPWTVYIQSLGFASGCAGWSMLRVADAMSLWFQYPGEWSTHYRLYFAFLVFGVLWFGSNAMVIVSYLMTAPIPALLEKELPEGRAADFSTDRFPFQAIWALIAALLPPLRLILMPSDLYRLQVCQTFSPSSSAAAVPMEDEGSASGSGESDSQGMAALFHQAAAAGRRYFGF